MQAKTHDLGNLFVQRLSLKKGTSLYHRYVTNEIEPPFRTALAHIIRVPGTGFGLALGRWKHTDREEDEALLDPISGRGSARADYTPTNRDKVAKLVNDWAVDDIERIQ